MMEKTIRIKGMVCRRCIATVKDIFMQEGFSVNRINLGEVVYRPLHALASLEKVRELLFREGFEVLDDKQSQLIAKVKELVASLWTGQERHHKNLSAQIAEALHTDYDSVSALFTAIEGLTLEHYVIGKRVEQAQRWLLQTDLSLTDIAFQLEYSSVHHFSNQFKKMTGLSPSAFRQLKREREVNQPNASSYPV